MPSISETLAKRAARRNDADSRAVDVPDASGAAFTLASRSVWRSRLSWKIAATMFMTLLLIRTTILNFSTIGSFEKQRLDDLSLQVRSGLAAIIDSADKEREGQEQKGQFIGPYETARVERLLRTTPLLGFDVYTHQYEMIGSFGSRPQLKALFGNLEASYRSPDGVIYETIFKGADMQSPYIVVAKINSSGVKDDVFYFALENIGLMIFVSLVVTFVLMIVIGRWLIEPVLFMRSNLVAAFKNPEMPGIKKSPYGVVDEIGAAIALTQRLIEQNAENLMQIKSTAEDKIHRLAYYDTLTALPNRALFVQKLSENARSRDDDQVDRFAVVTVDLDHFKDINDSMGHNVGDAILRSVGKRLRSALPESAMVSRTGEDEFALMLPLRNGASTSREVAERVLGVIRNDPFKVFNEEFQVRASVGVATFPDDGIEPDLVLKNADIALNRAKEEGRDRVKEYSEDFDRAVQARFQMLRDLRDALENEDLQLYFQPQLDLKTGEIIGAEALIRWWRPDNSKEGGSFISPVNFIPVAEQSGLIVPIGEWVMRQAVKVGKQLQDEHDISLRFAINVSGNQFSQSNIVGFVDNLLRETRFDPKYIELEVTESVFMHDIKHTVLVLQRLHSLGLELAIDDFGTGYSSLSYLSQFPIDRLKIDQSFIRNALNDLENASIARTIINLGHSLNLKVIAEGVETKAHEEFLINQGCDEVQGYRYCRPVPVEKLVEFVKSYNGKLDSFDG